MKFKAYHKIRQFKDIVRDVQFKANFKGLDDNDQPIYEESKKPVLNFTATTKLHGSNAQVCFDGTTLQAGKRGSLIGKDELQAHFGFNQFVQVEKKEFFLTFMKGLWETYCEPNEQIMVYGEWAGNGIQKSVGISELPKAFYIFDCKVYNAIAEKERWVNVKNFIIEESKVYNIYNFPTWNLEIDFNNPGLFQNKLVEITEDIEKECPVSKDLGISNGCGEGAVWSCFWQDNKYIFKVKGQLHSTSKVKKLASVDPEILKSIQDFVEYACTPNRIEQGIQEVEAKDKKDTPLLLKWVANDIIQEETDTLVSNSLEWKQVARDVSNRVRQYFFTKLDKI